VRVCARNLPRRAIETRVAAVRALDNFHREVADNQRRWRVAPVGPRACGRSDAGRAGWKERGKKWEEVAHITVQLLILNATL
jgi:hypothetical protein